jgi:hypothetical protein
MTKERDLSRGDIKAELIAANVDSIWIDTFMDNLTFIDSSDQAALNALIVDPPHHGKAGLIKSRNMRNLLFNWKKSLDDIPKAASLPAGILTAGVGIQHVWLVGAAFPWAAVGSAILALLLLTRSAVGLTEVELSPDHCKVVALLWIERADKPTTVAAVHSALDGELGKENVSALLSDLADLGLLSFGISHIELIDELILSD